MSRSLGVLPDRYLGTLDVPGMRSLFLTGRLMGRDCVTFPG